jgi:hypothetical protein
MIGPERHPAGGVPIGVRTSGGWGRILPLPLREGVGGKGAHSLGPWLCAPFPPTPSLKGRGRILHPGRLS